MTPAPTHAHGDRISAPHEKPVRSPADTLPRG